MFARDRGEDRQGQICRELWDKALVLQNFKSKSIHNDNITGERKVSAVWFDDIVGDA
jgi:hypothetical protein